MDELDKNTVCGRAMSLRWSDTLPRNSLTFAELRVMESRSGRSCQIELHAEIGNLAAINVKS